MIAMVALLTLAAAAPVAGAAAARTPGEVQGTVASVDWVNGVVLLQDVRSTETGEPVGRRWPAGDRATTTVPAPASTVVIESQPQRIVVQQAPPQVEVNPAPRPLTGRRAWCDGAYTAPAGTNFGKCAKEEDSAKSSEQQTGAD
jgi:hypothetical protein